MEINGNLIGMVGIEEVFAEIKAMNLADNEEIKRLIFEKISSKNWIPSAQKETYAQALLEEYRVYSGEMKERPAGRRYPEIRVYGAGCPVCSEIDEMMMKILTEREIKADYRYVFDPEEIKASNIIDFPTITVNGQAVHKGMVENVRQLVKIIVSAIEKL